MHWVHHANRIQDDLRKSSVFLFKNNTCYDWEALVWSAMFMFKRMTSSIVQILRYNDLCFWFSYTLQTVAKSGPT